MSAFGDASGADEPNGEASDAVGHRGAALAKARALEEACDFAAAARAALSGADLVWAARLAALAKRDDIFAEVETAASAQGAELSRRIASDLLARGFGEHAGRLFELAGDFGSAGEAYAAAGEATRAATAFERAKRPADGAKALERALRDDPEDDRLRRTLGELLARHGRTENAIKVLQQMREGDQRNAALPLLARSLRGLGLLEAAEQVTTEMRALGIADEQPPAPADAETREVATGRLLFGRYEVAAEVAKTPHAHLYDAFDRVGGGRVAVKILAASVRGGGRDAVMRFEREAKALLKLQHPTIVSLHAYVSEGPALVLEWMSGGSLAQLLARESFAPSRAVEIASAVLTALGEAHRLGILHRDVKPSNVLFDAVGAPKLADFGAAHLGDLSTTVTAGAIGTLSYMAPEQRLGQPATAASDIYAVGALLYEMITKSLASAQRGAFEVETAPSSIHPDLRAEHDAIIASLLAEQPEQRPESAFAARKILEAVRWPTQAASASAPASHRSSVRPPALGQRMQPARDLLDGRDTASLVFDATLERHVLVAPLEEATLERVRAFARVTDTSMAAVLRASLKDGVVWIEAPRGACLADSDVPLSPSELGAIRHALTSLHQASGAHGCLDRSHVYRHEGSVFVAFPRAMVPCATAIDDLRALETLSKAGSVTGS